MERTDQTEETGTNSHRLILNPVSGQGGHAKQVHQLADRYGFAVWETERPDHGIELGKQAADDNIDLLAVCGGDGTIHEVVQGLYTADALDEVTLCVIPSGTENIIATELGIEGVTDGFEVAKHGETRWLDLGVANDEPFVMSTIAGLPADVSAAATLELKQQYGSFGFVIGAIQESLRFDGFKVEVDTVSSDGALEWSGEALAVLVGNVRQFAKTSGQANAEDGRLELTIVEQMPSSELVAQAIGQRLLQQDTPHVHDLQAAKVVIDSLDTDPITFSLDGEIRTFETVQIGVRPRSLQIRVGAGYDPIPET